MGHHLEGSSSDCGYEPYEVAEDACNGSTFKELDMDQPFLGGVLLMRLP